jgi:hypothetical protein
VAVGIYTTNNVEACQYITEHSEAEVRALAIGLEGKGKGGVDDVLC